MAYQDDGIVAPSAADADKKELEGVMRRYKKAKSRWSSWSDIWEEIYDYVLPHRESFFQESAAARRTENIYDETAVVGLPKLRLDYNLDSFHQTDEPLSWLLGQSSPSSR